MKLLNEILNYFQTWGVYIGSVSVGVIAKISYEISQNRKMTLLQWFAIILISVFSGYLATVICLYYGLANQTGFIVPMVTLLGEKAIIYMSNNYKPILDAILRRK